MKQITLRIPEAGYTRLVDLSEKFGVSFRAIFEAATTISMADEYDPARRAMQLKLWGVARRLQDSPEFRAEPRRKVIARMDDCLAAQLADSCSRFGVTQNAALGLVVMPWPPGDHGVFRKYRSANLHRIIDLARQLDSAQRRRLRSGDPGGGRTSAPRPDR